MACFITLTKYKDEKMSPEEKKERKNAKVYVSFKHIKHDFLGEITIFHIVMTFLA